ncbi:MAG: hypothetical protein ACRDOK_18390 [Streptosporangiaceae bacterium]
MPPILFALTSDLLIAVVRRAALGKAAADDAQRSAWHVAGRSLLYGMRLAVDGRGTAAGLRRAIVNATPLPQAAMSAALNDADSRADGASPAAGCGTADFDSTANHRWPRPATTTEMDYDGEAGRARSLSRNGTKTARFLGLAQERYGPLAEFDLASVYRVSAELAPKVRLNSGSARAAPRAAILAARDGAP